jgi:hypothetical protein
MENNRLVGLQETGARLLFVYVGLPYLRHVPRIAIQYGASLCSLNLFHVHCH